MLQVSNTRFLNENREEFLPGYTSEYPYIQTRAHLDRSQDGSSPWHWHGALELFYVESGLIEYNTPAGQQLFPAGTGGLVNANVLHMTRRIPEHGETIQRLHLFDPSIIAGAPDSRIYRRYAAPMLANPRLELLALRPDAPGQREALDLLRESFALPEDGFGSELRLRAALSEIWLRLLPLAESAAAPASANQSSDKLKTMMIFIHEHYAEKLSIPEIARSAYMSERACYRMFRECLRCSPLDYVVSYRLQHARRLLADTDETVTRIAQACGFASSSHFGKLFMKRFGCTPLQYRQSWQNRDKNWR